jgi:rod shape-determining protein MreD
MTRRVLVLGLLLVTAVLIDTVMLSGLSIAGVTPSIVVLTVVAVGLTDGAESGTRYGFAAGLLVDLLSGGLVGLSALVLLLVGFGSGVVRPFLTSSTLLTQVVAAAIGGAFAVFGYGVLSLLFGPEGQSGGAVLVGSVVAAGMSALLAPLVLPPVSSVLRRVDPALLPG